VMITVGLAKMLQERLQAATIHPRQVVSTQTLPAGGINRCVKVAPLINAPHDVRPAKPPGAIASLVPVDQTEARFVEGQDLQRLVVLRFALAELLPYLASEVFLKASCFLGSAFSWRGRAVLSFTLRRLRSAPTLSG
jgi:hypothetical protein